MKYMIMLALVAVLGALIYAGVSMVQDGRDGKPKTNAMMRALALRVAISVLLFVCIWAAYLLGWLRPTGIPLSG